MGQVRMGTASWTDRTLIESGWYPPQADTPEKRLRFYARQFPLVEVDATYYALPAEQTAQAWAERTPAGFTFNVKAFSLFTQHPTPVRALPADLREAASASGKDRVYLKDVDPAVADQAWERFLAALEPLREAGKLGAILLQFPPWFPIGRANKDYIVACAERVAPRRVCVEFRNRTWMSDSNQQETLDFLSSHNLPYVCVDMPQGYTSSIPPVVAATSDLAVVRMHGHSEKWDSKDIYERFGYRYTDAELDEWAGNVRGLAAGAEMTHVLFNNCYRDYAQVNAQQLAEKLSDLACLPGTARGSGAGARREPGGSHAQPALSVGGAWLRRIWRPSGLRASVVPSGCWVICQPQRWMQTSWWNWHNSTQESALVVPPCFLCLVWCTSHQAAGRPQRGQAQRLSRSRTARRMWAGMVWE